MDFSYVLKTAKFDESKLAEFGFLKTETPKAGNVIYFFDKSFYVENFEFYVSFELSGEQFSAKVFESETEEPYVLCDVPSASGEFVIEVRQKVFDLVAEIKKNCFFSTDIKQKFVDFVQNRFSVFADNPFRKDSLDTMVFRTTKKSWFALVMSVKMRSLGFESEEIVSVVNLKHRPEDIDEIVDNRCIFNAYHMNKKHWITVLLNSDIDFAFLRNLTEESYDLVVGKQRNKRS